MALGRVVVFSIPGCSHCVAAKSLLVDKGIAFHEIDLVDFPARRQECLERSGSKTVPQIFLNGKCIGGNSELQRLAGSGELDAVVQSALAEPLSADSPMTTPEYLEATCSTDRGGGSDAGSTSSTDASSDESKSAAKADDSEDRVERLVSILRGGLDIRDRWYHFRSYPKCFVGAEALDWMVAHLQVSRDAALGMCQELVDRRIVHHVTKDHHFKDAELFYRFQEDEDTNLLNVSRIFDGASRPAQDVAEALRRQILLVHSRFLSRDGRVVDYAGIRKSGEFTAFVRAATELQSVNLAVLSHNDRMAFFINLYNALVIHGLIVLGVPKSAWGRLSFFSTVAYNINGHTFSLDDIEHGVLRRNRRAPAALRPQFSGKDPRLAVMVSKVDPRLHFALVCGAKSCPPVKLFRGDDVEDTLTCATAAFLEDDGNLSIDEATNTVTMSKIFGWYKVDFGGTADEALLWMLPYLNERKRSALVRMLGLPTKSTEPQIPSADAVARLRVKYFDYDWELNGMK